MNAERRLEPRLDRWFAERAATLSEPREGFEEMLEMLAATPQRRRRWWLPAPEIGPLSAPRKLFGRMAMVLSTGLAAALVLLAFGIVSLGLLGGPDRSTQPQPAIGTEAQATTTPATTDPPTAPASAAPSATPTSNAVALETYQAVLAGLELKEVAPGVFRVVADAIGRPMRNIDQLTIAPDGRVWIIKRKQLVEVGERGGYEQPSELVVGRDGRLFRMDWQDTQVWELGDDGWRPLLAWPTVGAPGFQGWYGWRLVGSTESGELWATSPDVPRAARFEGDTWIEFEPRDMDIDWPADADLELVGVADLELAADGSIWAWLREWRGPEAPGDGQDAPAPVDTLVRYDGVSWEQVTPPGGPLATAEVFGPLGPRAEVLHPGQGSSMWVHGTYPEAELMHWDGETWSTALAPRSSDLVIDRGERVWSLKRQGDPALLGLDGSAWSTYAIPVVLSEVATLQLAPDDSLWILSESGEPYILYPDQMGSDGGAQS
jgi:hypothetical protein